MIVKSRVESLELQILRMLNSRMSLSPKEHSNYLYLEKGYEGEVIFDRWMEEVEKGFLVLNDLLLEHGNTKFQIRFPIPFPDHPPVRSEEFRGRLLYRRR